MYYPTFELGFLDDFEDLENVSEMVAETSEASNDQQAKVLPVKTTRARARARVAKSAVSENNTCTCTSRICNLICAEKVTFQREKMSCL